ncbi:MAG TPA: sigma-54 dependent transcriptional regulator [Gemmatimonadales bacterium]|nr:sigma-54 dependent transcriptional regulator [Gemmatimonadales bacterium]
MHPVGASTASEIPLQPEQVRARPRILVVEDDEAVRNVLRRVLEPAGYDVEVATTGSEGLLRLGTELYDLVLLDLHLPGVSGMELLHAGPARQADAQFIMITGDATVDTALEAMRLGAYDYLRKPVCIAELLLVLERALEERERRREVTSLRLSVSASALSAIVGKAPAVHRMFDLIKRVAPTRANVLITGETGTGKELVARTIHALSDRVHKPFVPVHCSALSETLLESELFGHMKGSFTGAVETKRGLFEEARDGTLFLDEVATLSPVIQVKLLRTIQERQIQRVGANQAIPVSFRLITATNRNLEEEVAAGRFREDLFFRLNVFPIEVPPLRERRTDIPLLAAYFRQRAGQANGITPPELSPELLRRLGEYDWPGNVRELENFIERAVIMYMGAKTIPASSAHWEKRQGELLERGTAEFWSLDRMEREYILKVLEQHQWHQSRASKVLGIDRRTLFRKLQRYQREGFLQDQPLEDALPED